VALCGEARPDVSTINIDQREANAANHVVLGAAPTVVVGVHRIRSDILFDIDGYFTAYP